VMEEEGVFLPSGTILPMEARPATSKAEMAALVEVLAEVSTYMAAPIWWLKLSAWSAEMGARPCLARLVRRSRSDLRSEPQPTRMMGTWGSAATDLISGHQWLRAEKRVEGSVIL